MAERGKAKYAFLSSGSNNVVVTTPGTLYGIHGAITAGSFVRVDDAHSFPQGVLNLNASSSNTIGHLAIGSLYPGIGFNAGLVVAFASNSGGLTVVYE